MRRANVFQARRQLARRPAPSAPPKPAPEERDSNYHHNVYVVLLEPDVARMRRVQQENPERDPAKPCVYVGMTGLDPVVRLANHKAGIKAAYVVKRWGLRLLPELFAHLNPMPFEAAAIMERDLAEDLRRQGFTVTGGH